MTNSRSLGFLGHPETCSRVGSVAWPSRTDCPHFGERRRQTYGKGKPPATATLPSDLRRAHRARDMNDAAGASGTRTEQPPDRLVAVKSAVSRHDSLPIRSWMAGGTASGFGVVWPRVSKEPNKGSDRLLSANLQAPIWGCHSLWARPRSRWRRLLGRLRRGNYGRRGQRFRRPSVCAALTDNDKGPVGRVQRQPLRRTTNSMNERAGRRTVTRPMPRLGVANYTSRSRRERAGHRWKSGEL
jgi:hypothetical protein